MNPEILKEKTGFPGFIFPLFYLSVYFTDFNDKDACITVEFHDTKNISYISLNSILFSIFFFIISNVFPYSKKKLVKEKCESILKMITKEVLFLVISIIWKEVKSWTTAIFVP